MQLGITDHYLNSGNITVTNIWQKYTWTVTPGSVNISNNKINAAFGVSANTNGQLYICGMKLEKGNKATDWSEAFEEYYTKSEAEARITETVNEINLSVSNTVTEAVDSIIIGGSQILRGTNNMTKVQGNVPAAWSAGQWRNASGGTGTVNAINVTDCPNGNIKTGVKVNVTASSSLDACQDNVPVVEGEEYTISCYARATSGSPQLSLQFGVSGGYSGKNMGVVAQTWTRYSRTFKVGSTNHTSGKTSVYFGMRSSTGTVEICGMKLEKGNKATDWSDSSEDVQSSISSLSVKADGIQTTVTNHTSDISTLKQKVGSVETTVSSHTGSISKLEQRAGTIESSVTDINNNFGTKITQNSESVRVAWNNIDKYIQFDKNDGLVFYYTSNSKLAQFDDNRLAFFNSNGGYRTVLDRENLCYYNSNGQKKINYTDRGMWLYENEETIGLIGANTYDGHPDIYGLNFDLDSRGTYMTWASREGTSESYDMKLTYTKSSMPNFGREAIWCGTNFEMGWHDIKFDNGGFIRPHSNGLTINGMQNLWLRCRQDDSIYLECNSEANIVNINKDLNMNGRNINNASNLCDGRLKTSIYSTTINAIDKIKQIKHRQFKWKKDNSFEEVGYIAQEMEKISTNYVQHNYKEDKDGNVLMDSYEMRLLPLIATATKAIQEQQEIIEKQQKQINTLMEKLGIQQDIPHEKETFIEEPETIFNGEVKFGEFVKPKELTKYNMVMKYLDNGNIDIVKEPRKEE